MRIAQLPHPLVAMEYMIARPDNHLEGSSIRLYSVVSCAKRNVNRQPNEETQMALYVGIDLHANNSVVVVLDEQDRVV
jgi:hypothetical protein